MKILFGHKDGGPESNVTCWGIEIKGWFSVLLLRFAAGSREAYHNHAFNSISWILSGRLEEIEPVTMASLDAIAPGYHDYTREIMAGMQWSRLLLPSFTPVITPRKQMHKVYGHEHASWVITFRGPWDETWNEYLPKTNEHITLTHGRTRVE